MSLSWRNHLCQGLLTDSLRSSKSSIWNPHNHRRPGSLQWLTSQWVSSLTLLSSAFVHWCTIPLWVRQLLPFSVQVNRSICKMVSSSATVQRSHPWLKCHRISPDSVLLSSSHAQWFQRRNRSTSYAHGGFVLVWLPPLTLGCLTPAKQLHLLIFTNLSFKKLYGRQLWVRRAVHILAGEINHDT